MEGAVLISIFGIIPDVKTDLKCYVSMEKEIKLLLISKFKTGRIESTLH